MIDYPFSLCPNTEKLRTKLNAPFSAIITPAAKTEIPFIDVNYKEFARCKKCKAYYSNLCEKTDNSWKCAVCDAINSDSLCNFLPEGNDYEIKVNDTVGVPILVLYFDLGFCEKDIETMKPSIIAFLKSLKDTNLMVLFGNQGVECSLLAPHYSFFKKSGEIIVKKDKNENMPNLEQFNSIPAPIVNFTAVPNDFSPFIFSPEQIPSAILAFERIQQGMKNSFKNAIRLIVHISETAKYTPIHFISITRDVTFIPDAIRKYYENLLCLDLLTPTYNKETQSTNDVIPGRVLFFTGSTLLNILSFCTREKPIYQLLMCCRSRNAKPTWRPSPSLPQYLSQNTFCCPIIHLRRQPFVLDIHPMCTDRCENIFYQLTAKMTRYNPETHQYSSILRIFNRTIKTSNSINDIVASVDPNALMWLWITRTLQKPPRDVVAALYRAVANFISLLPKDSEAAQSLIRICCAIRFLGFTSTNGLDVLIGKQILTTISPKELSLDPEIVVNDKTNKETAVTAAGIYADDANDEVAVEEAVRLGYLPKIISPIPEWCKTPDPQSLEFLESLLPDDE